MSPGEHEVVAPIPVQRAFRATALALAGDFSDLLDQLVAGYAYRCGERPAPPAAPGVYVFADGPLVIHVGRTRNLQARRRDQTGPSNDRHTATLAFRLAVAKATAAHADLPMTRALLERESRFRKYFIDAKSHVRDLDFRCIELADSPRQAMFEIFASVALGLPPELWRTH
jgi:hypothetical protein